MHKKDYRLLVARRLRRERCVRIPTVRASGLKRADPAADTRVISSQPRPLRRGPRRGQLEWAGVRRAGTAKLCAPGLKPGSWKTRPFLECVEITVTNGARDAIAIVSTSSSVIGDVALRKSDISTRRRLGGRDCPRRPPDRRTIDAAVRAGAVYAAMSPFAAGAGRRSAGATTSATLALSAAGPLPRVRLSCDELERRGG